MSGVVGATARAGGAGLAGVVGAQALGGAVVGAAGGALFGLAYGTAIRIGYEQIYPALFPDGKPTHDLVHILDALEKLFDFVGGKAAHIFGVEQGVKAHASTLETQNFTYGDIRKEDSQTFLATLDNFFKSITPLPSAYGHTETSGTINQNLAQTYNTDKQFNDAIASAEGDTLLLKDFRDKISNYDHTLLATLLKTETDSEKRAVIIALINATPEAFAAIPQTPSSSDAIRKTDIAESGLSPLATAAVATFKQNIDAAVTTVSITQIMFQTVNERFLREVSTINQNRFRTEQELIPLRSTRDAAVKKLSALRIKFKETYGYYY